ncbi:hypothetical protein TNCV_2956791 [Trichonephila clavipes]|nr:hypothetical protein TNCV_2956791 [Trichonephila clavipes]
MGIEQAMKLNRDVQSTFRGIPCSNAPVQNSHNPSCWNHMSLSILNGTLSCKSGTLFRKKFKHLASFKLLGQLKWTKYLPAVHVHMLILN